MPDKQVLLISEIQGIVKIICAATLHVTHITEDLHQQIIHPPYLPSTPIQHLVSGISRIVYKSIRATTTLVEKGVMKGLSPLDRTGSIGISIHQKEMLISILNGIVGDYLAQDQNPLAIPMQFRQQGIPISLKREDTCTNLLNTNGKILLMVHGLCMDDLQWKRKGFDHGEKLAQEFGLSPIYLRYNSGLHISQNGVQLSALLENLINNWPVPVEEIIVLAHSMGGLISRSAYHYGHSEGKTWPQYLKKMIFLGSPHQGAPLEKIGNHIDHLLDLFPYTKPFARLGKIRSAGITDLRFGQLLTKDWKDLDRFSSDQKQVTFVPLPKEVACYAIAATLSSKNQNPPLELLGDGLVPIKSALGQAKDSMQDVGFLPQNTMIIDQTNHLALLSSSKVYQQIKIYLSR